MDILFETIWLKDDIFKDLWAKVPYIFCEDDGQSHTLAIHKMQCDTPHIKQIFKEKPPYVLKLWNKWGDLFTDVYSDECLRSNGNYAIELSTRVYTYKHTFKSNVDLTNITE
jgi:hypothetical protein